LSTSLDDIYLAYWPAYTLSTYGQILNYNGERLEQSSSLLHVALLAILAKLSHVSFPVLAYFVALLSALLTLIATYRLGSLIDQPASGRYSAVLLATSPSFVYYSVNTLETALAAFLTTLLLILIQRYLSDGIRLPHLSLCVLLFLLVRAETFLLLVVPVAGLLLLLVIFPSMVSAPSPPLLRRRLFVILSLGIGLQLVICGSRYVYFGDYVPHTVRAKISTISLERLTNGFWYLFGRSTAVRQGRAAVYWYSVFGSGIVVFTLVHAVSLLRLLHLKRPVLPLRPALFPYLFMVSYFAYVIIVGGDWMEGGRFLVPVLPVLSVLVSADIVHLLPSMTRLTKSIPILLLLSYHLLGDYCFATSVSRGRPLWSYLARDAGADPDLRRLLAGYNWVETVARGHLRDIPTIAALENIIAAQPRSRVLSLMSHQGGMVMFYVAKRFFGRIQFIDLCGLFSSHVPSCPEAIDLARFQTPYNAGTIVPWEYYFAHKDDLRKACHMPLPDVIFDLYFSESIFPLLEQNGYVVVFKSQGYIRGRSFLDNDYGPATEFIALKKDFFREVGATPVVWDWEQKTP